MDAHRQGAGGPERKLLIDLGAVSEDVIPNRILNSEDLVISSSPNGTLQEGEDVGIDMLTDAQERDRYAAMIARYPAMDGDPSGDNYAFNNATVGTFQEDYTRINGTENNKDGPGGRIPDSEDLNANGVVDLSNSFFQYELPLDDNPLTNPRIVGGNPEFGWYQFRIPIKEYVADRGITHVREHRVRAAVVRQRHGHGPRADRGDEPGREPVAEADPRSGRHHLRRQRRQRRRESPVHTAPGSFRARRTGRGRRTTSC